VSYGQLGEIEAMPEADRDREEFERLMRQSYKLVYRIAYSVLKNTADAEDVAQETFLTAYEKMSSLRDPERFRPWVARSAWRMALNRRRGTTRSMGRDNAWFASRPAEEYPEARAKDQEFESQVRAQVELLPEKLRVVVLLIGVEEMDVRTVAGILNIPEGTVRSRLHLARKQLLRKVAR
jgi:RNA polymerase sigma-70 factor (ECF subfamily)